jgi:hypothetical protein
MEQAMAGAGGAGGKVTLFDQVMGNTAQGKVPGNPTSSGSASNNNDIRFDHG